MEVKQSENLDVNKSCPLKLVEFSCSHESSVIEKQIYVAKNCYEDTNKAADDNFAKALLKEQETSLKEIEGNKALKLADNMTFCRPVTNSHLLYKFLNEKIKLENFSELETKDKDNNQALWEKYINKLTIKHEEFLKLHSDSNVLRDDFIQESVTSFQGHNWEDKIHAKIRKSKNQLQNVDMFTNIRYADIFGLDNQVSSILSMRDHSAGHSDENIDNVSASNENIKTKISDVKFFPYLNIPFKVATFDKECYPISSSPAQLTVRDYYNLHGTHPVSADIPHSGFIPSGNYTNFDDPFSRNYSQTYPYDTDTQATNPDDIDKHTTNPNDVDTQTTNPFGLEQTTQTSNAQVCECEKQGYRGKKLLHIESKLDGLISKLKQVVGSNGESVYRDGIDDKKLKWSNKSFGSKKSIGVDKEYDLDEGNYKYRSKHSTKSFDSKKSIGVDKEYDLDVRNDNYRSKHSTKSFSSKKPIGVDKEYDLDGGNDNYRSKHSTKSCSPKKCSDVDDEYDLNGESDDFRITLSKGYEKSTGDEDEYNHNDKYKHEGEANSQCCRCPNDKSTSTWVSHPNNLIKKLLSFNAAELISFNNSEIKKSALPFGRNYDNISMIGDILKEENDKSDKAKQDIDEILNISRSSFFSVENDVGLIDDIIKEENYKSDKAKQDIDEILNISRSSFFSVENFELPTKKRSETIVVASQDINTLTEVKTINIESKNEYLDYPVSIKKSKRQVLIAVDTDVFNMVNIIKFPTTMINRLLYSINIGCALFRIKSSMPWLTLGYKRSTSRNSGSIYPKYKQISADRYTITNVANTATSVCRICRVGRNPIFKPQRFFKCEYCGKCFTRSYCRELHELDCARSKGLTHDVPEGLIFLR